VALTATVALVGAGLAEAHFASAATAGCQVSYTVTNQWPGGFGTSVNVNNLGDPINGWRLTWSFTAGQTVTQLWNGSFTQSGAQVTVTDAGYNGSIPSGGTANFGFNGLQGTSSGPDPTDFALNGVACTGATAPSTPTPTSSTPTPSTPAGSTT